jgi:hypothetical protein
MRSVTHMENEVNTSHRTRREIIPMLKPLVFMCALSVLLVGCASSTKSTILGRVISGPVGQSVGASPEDERFEEQGIPGVKVTVLTKTGSASRGRGVYASAVADEYGNFELSFANGKYPSDAVQVRVAGDGIFTSRSQTYMPPDGDKLLCVVITRPGHEFPEPPEEENKK